MGRLARIALVVAVTACIGPAVAFAYMTATSSPGATDPTATAATMPAGNAPAASVSSKTVTLSWSQGSIRSQLVGAYTSGGYTIRRYATSGGAQSAISTGTCASSVSGSAASLSCSETNVPDGNWTYTVTPTLYSWTGAESSKAAASAQVTVATATLDHFDVSAPASSTAGSAFSATVTARDAGNNTLTGYVGTVHFTSTDGAAVLPANYTFVAADNGAHTFTSGVTLKTAGSRTVSVNDTVATTKTGTSSAITVSGGTAAGLTFTAATVSSSNGGNNVATTLTCSGTVGSTSFSCTNSPAGSGNSRSVTAKVALIDAFQNLTTNTTGSTITVGLTSTRAGISPSSVQILAGQTTSSATFTQPLANGSTTEAITATAGAFSAKWTAG
jgi:hypothetical protein